MRYGQARTVLVAAAVIALAGCGASATTANNTTSANPTTANPTTANPTTSAEATTAAAASGSFKAACPSTAEVSATIGQTYQAPKQQSGGGTLTCTYNNSTDVLVVLFASVPGTTGADLKLAMDAQAKGQKATDNAVSGLGNAAYEFSSTTSGSLQTIVDMLDGSEDIDITSQASAAQTEALAHDVLGS
jgi:hypothetical protein